MTRILSILLLLLLACGRADVPREPPGEDRVVFRGMVFPGFDADRALLGSGWQLPELGEGSWGAWTHGRFADAVLVPGADATGFVLRARAREATAVTVVLDGSVLGTVSVTPEWTLLRLPATPAVPEAGFHRVTLEMADARPVFVSRLGLNPATPPDPWKRPDGAGPTSAWVLPLVHPGGAELELDWEGAGPVAWRLVDPVGGTVVHDVTGAARITVPDAAPPCTVLLTADSPVTPTGWQLRRELPGVDVVLLVVDTLRADHLSCYGHPTVRTPHLDRLAADGILFENAYSHIPITGPSHAALMTSKPPSEIGFLNNHRQKLGDRAHQFPQILDEHGYRGVAAVAIDPIRGYFGFQRGWDTYRDAMGHSWILPGDEILSRVEAPLAALSSPFFAWVHFAEPHEPYDAHGLVERSLSVHRDGTPVRTIPTSTYQPTVLAWEGREAEVGLESEDPFALRALKGLDGTTLDPPAPPRGGRTDYTFRAEADGDSLRILVSAHDPPGSLALVQERYGREVEAVDAHLGTILDGLRDRGLYDDALIVFTSDHGEGLGCHGHVGHVQNLYECQVRVPLFVKPPRGVGDAPGTRRDDLAALIDIMPTILDVAGFPSFAGMRGRSLVDPAQRRGPDDVILLETHEPQAQQTKYALRGGDWKFVWTPGPGRQELYNLVEDPGEKDDRADREPERAEDWMRRLQTTLDATRSTGAGASPLELDDEAREILRSLGYIE